MTFDAIEAALRDGEAEVTDQSLRHAIRLKVRDRQVFRLGLQAVEEFKAPDAGFLIFLVEVVAGVALFKEERGGKFVIPVACIVGAAEAELALRGNRADGSVG